MGWDPLSWALGFAATRGALYAYRKLFSPSLKDKLFDEVQRWAKDLPDHLWISASAIFPRIEDNPPPERRHLIEVRSALRSRQIPAKAMWEAALEEQWHTLRATNPENGAPFLTRTLEEVQPYLHDLADALVATFERDREAFQQQALKELEWSHTMLTNIASAVGVDDEVPVQEGTDEEEYFEFARLIERSYHIHPVTGREQRQFRIRLRPRHHGTRFRNVSIRIFAVLSRAITLPDGSVGYGNTWIELPLRFPGDKTVPRITRHWTLGHFIDSPVELKESPFIEYSMDLSISKVRLYVSVTANRLNTNRLFYDQKWYDWSRETTDYGRFYISDNDLPLDDDNFHRIIKGAERGVWPLLDV